MKKAAPRGVQCLDRAMDILEAVSAAGEAGVTELSTLVGLHVATVHNILRTLAARHYLLNINGRYRLGPAMAALASSWDPLQSLPGQMQPFLNRISARTGEAASAAILVGYSARLIAFSPGTEAVTIHYPQWEWPNAMSLATGRLLVALQPPEVWPAFIERNSGAQPYWQTERWTEELEQLRQLGCCVLQRHSGGQTAMAAPIRTAGENVLAAIGASAPTFRANSEHSMKMLREVHLAAIDLSRQLGWEGAPTPTPAIDWIPTADQE